MLGGQYNRLGRYPRERPLFRRRNAFVCLVLFVLALGITLTLLNIYQLHRMTADHETHKAELARIPEIEAVGDQKKEEKEQAENISSAPIVWLQGSPKSRDNGPTGYLKHVYRVFENMGFVIGGEHSDWVVAWHHDYPFINYPQFKTSLKPYQKVNHFPGSGFITNKVTLAQIDSEFIPKAFEIPYKKAKFQEYVKAHPDTSWVQKNNNHRGIKVKKAADLDLSKNGSFVQEFISKPFLIDGRKFDIGLYTVVTSMDPLRVYFVDGDALFRFCPQEYYPFDIAVVDKYVIGDDYFPLWKMPSLENLYLEQGYSFKDSIGEYLRSQGKDLEPIWEQMKMAIRDTFLEKENQILKYVNKYKYKTSFFELMRFDFVLDENLNVFLMEANMSPNLSSDHFSANARLYEHVIFNFLTLAGVGHFTSTPDKKRPDYEDSVLVSSQDIHVFPDYCSQKMCSNNCQILVCRLCNHCLTREFEKELKRAYLEHTRRGSMRRIFPPSMSQMEAQDWKQGSDFPRTSNLNLKNQLIYLWFIGKCRLDESWCH